MKKEKPKIHSALSTKGGVCPSSDKKNNLRYCNDRIIAFQHDVCDTHIPDEFGLGDCIHVGIAWRDGYDKFKENTIAKNTDFEDYVKGIKRICEELNVPSFILCGKAIAKKLNPPRMWECEFSHYGGKVVYAIWNYDGDLPSSTEEIKEMLGNNYNTVLDFSCGYGEIMRHFKKGILSDINTGCLDYIKNEYGLDIMQKT